MTSVLSRGNRARRGGRRPGWGLLTALLVLAIVASSVLVFTSRVELLKLAVILALWAAFAAAFVSVIYRRQSDVDRARARDLKLVYDLQLDREISARREYELTVESRLRRELASELRAQAADEVAALREELAVLRTNLQILFDTDLEHRPALETERTTVRAYSDWARYDDARYDDSRYNGEGASGARVRDDSAAPHAYGAADRTEENPIIDVPEVGVPAGGGNSEAPPQQPAAEARGRHTETYRGTHRRASDDALSRPTGRRRSAQERSQRYSTQHFRQRPESSAPQPESESPQAAGSPTPAANSDDTADSYEAAADDQAVDHSVVLNQPASGPHGRHHGRHSSSPAPVAGSPDGTGPRRHGEDSQQAHARHSADTGTAGPEPQTGGQSVSDLLARLQTDSAGRRRHRRED